MSQLISTFFDAWQVGDADKRLALISTVVTEGIHYQDPRTVEAITGIDALSDYLGMFNANAPGWSASVAKSDTTGKVTRVTVVFAGMGPEGTEQVQYGQYFVENQGQKISRMVGFVGTGN